MKKIRLLDLKERERYDRILQKLKNKLSLSIKKEDPVIKKSRVWQKFSKKILTTIVLPTFVLITILVVAVGLSVLLIYFGMEERVATLVGPAVALGVPFLSGMLRSLYRDALDEVASENKKLMRDLKGDRQ